MLTLVGTGAIICRLPHMPNEKEQQILWTAALKEIGSTLKREIQPEQGMPDRLRELIAQIEANVKNDE